MCCAPLQGQYIPLFLRAQVRASPCGASSFALSDSQGAFKVISDMRHLKPLLSLEKCVPIDTFLLGEFSCFGYYLHSAAVLGFSVSWSDCVLILM